MNFQNISQRSAASYQKSLAEFAFVAPQGCAPEEQAALEDAERQLHGFFGAAYDKMMQSPELFGLPLDADDGVDDDQPGRTEKLAEMNRKLRRVRGVIERGLDLLMAMGKDGRLEGQALVLELKEQPDLLKQFKAARKFFAGMESVGLRLHVADGKAVLSNPQYPAMLPALVVLAGACARCTDEKLSKFHFARCDFKALNPHYTPEAMDIYRVFAPDEQPYVAALHEFFTSKNYKPLYQIYGIFSWVVQYQGKRQIKGSPLFQVQYEERFRNQLRMQIKCASAKRLLPVISEQSAALQEDFFRRANPCQNCNWCDTRPHLGPSEVEFNGEKKTICWYINPDVRELNDVTVDLIEQYALMHETLN